MGQVIYQSHATSTLCVSSPASIRLSYMRVEAIV